MDINTRDLSREQRDLLHIVIDRVMDEGIIGEEFEQSTLENENDIIAVQDWMVKLLERLS